MAADEHEPANVQQELKEFRQSVDKRFDAVDKRFDAVDKRFEEVDKRFDEFEKRILNAFKTHAEHLETVVKMAAEGFGATLQRIERDVSGLRSAHETRLDDHDRVLKDHGRRITTLEAAKKS